MDSQARIFTVISLLAWLLLSFASCAEATNISGTYTARSSSAAFIIQLVESGGGQVVGHFEQAVLQDDGKIQYLNASINGAVNGKTIVATFNQSAYFAGPISVSGTADGSVLQLSGGGANDTLRLFLRRGSEQDFQAAVVGLTAHGSLIKNQRKRAAQAKDIASLIKQETSFSNDAEHATAKFKAAGPKYQKLTEKMQANLAREQAIVGQGRASVARGRVDVAIYQDAGRAHQTHASVAYDVNFLAGTFKQLREKRSEAQRICAFVRHPASAGDIKDELSEQCSEYSRVDALFGKRAIEAQRALTSEDKVWHEELAKQNDITKAADEASRY